MKIILFVLLTMLFFTNVISNPMTWPYMPASDYFRGTAGEHYILIFLKKIRALFISTMILGIIIINLIGTKMKTNVSIIPIPAS